MATVALLVLGGCVERSHSDGTTVVTFASWVKIAVVAACPVALFAGLRLRKAWMKWKGVLIVMSLVGATIVAPSVFADRVEIDGKGLRTSTGIWFAPKVKDIRFAEVQAIWVPHAQPTSRRRTPIVVRLHGGATVTVAQGDLLTQCLDDIADAAKAAGIAVTRLD